MKVTVAISTVGDRGDYLAFVLSAWAQVSTPGVEMDVRVIEDQPTCGDAANAVCEYLHDNHVIIGACDDTVPLFDDLAAPLALFTAGKIPHARYLTTAGDPLAEQDADWPAGTVLPWTRMVWTSGKLYREMGPFLPQSWYLDIDYSERLPDGWQIVACPEFTFCHLDAPRTWQTPALQESEYRSYLAARAARGDRLPADARALASVPGGVGAGGAQ